MATSRPVFSTSPIFIHSLWRSSSTWFFSKFRAAPGYFAYQEPLHEAVLAAAENPDFLKPMQPESAAALRHLFLPDGHFHELRITHTHWRDQIRHCRTSIYERYFDQSPDPQLGAFYQSLIQSAAGRPVLQECRTSLRIAPIKAQIGGIHLALVRNPRDQWWSFKATPYFEAVLQLLMQAAPCPAAITRIARSAKFTPVPNLEISDQIQQLIRTPLNHQDSYRLFFTIWCLAADHALSHADLVIDTDAFGNNTEERIGIAEKMDALGMLPVDFSGFLVPSGPMTTKAQNFFASIEADVLTELRIDGFSRGQFDALQEILARKELIRNSVSHEDGIQRALNTLDQREETIFSSQDRERRHAELFAHDLQNAAIENDQNSIKMISEMSIEVSALAAQLDRLRVEKEAAEHTNSTWSEVISSALRQQAETFEQRLNEQSSHQSELLQRTAERARQDTEAVAERRLSDELKRMETIHRENIEAHANRLNDEWRRTLDAALQTQAVSYDSKIKNIVELLEEKHCAELDGALKDAEISSNKILIGTLNQIETRYHEKTNEQINRINLTWQYSLDTALRNQSEIYENNIVNSSALLSEDHRQKMRSLVDAHNSMVLALNSQISENKMAISSVDNINKNLYSLLSEAKSTVENSVITFNVINDSFFITKKRKESARFFLERSRSFLESLAASNSFSRQSFSTQDLPKQARQDMDHNKTNASNPFHRANSLTELCDWIDVDFIRCAYVTLLGRQPDAAGEADYLRRLRRGIHKLTIIDDLRRSGEGRAHDPGIAGLDKALRKHRNSTRPVVGPLIRLLTGREGNGSIERQLRAMCNKLDKFAQQSALWHDLLDRRMSALQDEFRASEEHQANPVNSEDRSLEQTQVDEILFQSELNRSIDRNLLTERAIEIYNKFKGQTFSNRLKK